MCGGAEAGRAPEEGYIVWEVALCQHGVGQVTYSEWRGGAWKGLGRKAQQINATQGVAPRGRQSTCKVPSPFVTIAVVSYQVPALPAGWVQGAQLSGGEQRAWKRDGGEQALAAGPW